MADDLWSYVSLAMHMDGKNGSTAFVDLKGHPCTAVGGACISTAASKYGGSSAIFPLAGAYIEVSPGADLLFSTGDFTIEAWVYMSVTPGSQGGMIFGRHQWGKYSDYILSIDSSRKLQVYLNAVTTTYTSDAVLPLNEWVFVTASRTSGRLTLGVGGVTKSFTASASTDYSGSSGLFTIGADQGGDAQQFIGYIDDLRVTKGVGRYPADFTPPSEPFWPVFEAMVPTLRAAPGALSAFAMPAKSARREAAITGSRDLYFGGNGQIADTVKKKSGSTTVPVARRVRLHEQLSGIVVAETWSSTDGAYRFSNLNRAYTYYVLAFDHTGEYPAGVIAENLVPEVMG